MPATSVAMCVWLVPVSVDKIRKNIRILPMTAFIRQSSLALLLLISLGTNGALAVPASGNVYFDGTPICALVLINGVSQFSCDGNGRYDMEVPVDANGMITVQVFADGFAPFNQIVIPDQAAAYPVAMAQDQGSPSLDIGATYEPSATEGRLFVSGSITIGGAPVCALVLANGVSMFSCGGAGQYSLDVPLDQDGNVTLMVFAAGFKPYKETAAADDLCVEPNTFCAITEVSGMILVDTTWTVEQGLIRFVGGGIQVGPEATLTIEEGVEFGSRFDGVSISGILEVFGRLIIQGTADKPVVATNIAVGGSVAGPVLLDINYLHYKSTVPCIGFLEVHTNVSLIFRNSILYPDTCDIRISSSQDTFIESNIFLGMLLDNGPRINVSGDGIAYIKNNLFEANVNPLSANLITCNFCQSSSRLVLKYNSFLSSDGAVISAPFSDGPLDVSENYWGTTDINSIENRILDRNDDLNYGTYIKYLPVLPAPHPDTPIGF